VAGWQVAAIVVVIIVAASGAYYYSTTVAPSGGTSTTSGPTIVPEGNLAIYGSVAATDIQGALNAFKSRYPSVTVDYEEMTPPVGFTRITGEISGNKPTADVAFFTNTIELQLASDNYLISYNSSERSAYSSDYKDTKGYWTTAVLIPTVFAYNTQLITKSALPSTLTDLASPQWRGKVTMHDITIGSTGTQYMLSLVPILGNSTWTTFVQSLQANVHPTLNSATSAVADNVASGQYQIGLIAFLQDVLRLKLQGAPIDWFLPQGVPMMTALSSVGILKAAQHPNVARLFIDFILSATGQKALGDAVVRIPARPNVGAKYSLENVAQGQKIVLYPTASVVAQARTWGANFKAMGFGA